MDDTDTMTETNQASSTDKIPVVIFDEVKQAPSLAVPETGFGEIMPAPMHQLEKNHGEFANFQESYVRSYIALADTKAAWTFTISSGALAYMIGSEKIKKALITPEFSWPYAAIVFSIVLLTISAFFSFRVVAPRLSSKSGEGIVFFGSVALEKDAIAYVRSVAGHDEPAIIEARLKHCYDVSVVCKRKYDSLKMAIWFGLPALVVMLIAMIQST